jgi:glycogen debranching enzyme
MEAPPEPKELYPDPPLNALEELAIIRGSTFFSATRKGDVMPEGSPQVGLFSDDTRFLSRLDLRVNGQEPIILSSTNIGADRTRVELTVRGGSASGVNLDLPVNTVYIHREQLLDRSRLYDVLHLQNFHYDKVLLKIEILFAADFMDIFQVRGLLRGKSGRYYRPETQGSQVRLCYEGLDDRSRTTTLSFSPEPQRLEGAHAQWEVELERHGSTRITTTIDMKVEPTVEHVALQENTRDDHSLLKSRHRSAERQEQWLETRTRFRSDNAIFDAMLQSAAEDFYALQMTEPQGVAVAAGVPWFAAIFGRDSLISSYETLLLDPSLAAGVLRVLAAFQGTTRNDERDEDPGKILHERRSGEMTATDEVPFGRSYGSVDSTPLFLILAEQYFRWTGDRELLEELKGALMAATNWILQYGDLDNDGLIEYSRRNPKGLFNQGWKDSGDAIRHRDGRIAEPPIALVEVQGYAVRGLACAAELFHLLGEPDLARLALRRSRQIRKLIERCFWLDDRSFYAMALDSDKEPLRVDSSNPGHLLFAAAVSPSRAAQITQRVLAKGLFSGWGIRTLSDKERTFNPMSYHCGSVWPHDNALIGYGMARYGLRCEASMIFRALYDAALHFHEYRLPELFCGVERQLKSEPVHYPVSCSPQAWAAGTPFLLLTGLLGLEPRADRHELAVVAPHLPAFLRSLRIENLRVGSSRLVLEFLRDGERTYCNVVDVKGEEIKISIVFPSRNKC